MLNSDNYVVSLKTELIKKLNDLIIIHNFDEAEKIMEELLANEPYNTELWLRYAVLELNSPLTDPIRSIECLNKIFQYDKYNFEAILLLCCIYHFHLGDIDDELISKLDSVKTNDKEKLSMIEYIKSWYYDRKEDNKMYEQVLLKSIELFSGNVLNYKRLAQFYVKNGNIKRSQELIKLALKNITLVYSKDYFHDFTDVNEYFNEFVRGIHSTSNHYESLEEELMQNPC